MVKKLLTYGTPKRLFVSGSPKLLTAGEGGCACCVPPCEYCDTGTTPKQIQIVLAGIANYIYCAVCASFNGTYILDQVAGTPCRWRYYFPSPICHYEYIFFDKRASGACQFWIYDQHAGGGPYWQKASGLSADCASWEDIDLPYGGSTDVQCDWSTTGVCTLSSLPIP